jgi:dihydrofolate synthase/folylpolyglutamate synthase
MKRFTRYKDVLKYMFDKLPMYQRVGPQAYKKDLTNTLLLLEAVGNPHLNQRCIHVAGTNGKGSTSHLIAGGLQALGYSVGLYTSPHYKDFRERIKINGVYIGTQYIKNFINTWHTDIESIQPSFFELTVALAFRYFADQQTDFTVIETGLGGRLDSTNIITPLISVITNISFDHMNMLGDTLDKIAFEKAGIIKPAIPVVIGEKQPEIARVFKEKAAKEAAPIYFAEDILQVSAHQQGSKTVYSMIADGKPWIDDITFDIGGPFQEKNITTAFATLYLLKEHIVPDPQKWMEFFPELSKKTRFMGRWQILSESPFILADSAHNEGGLQYVLDYLKNLTCNRLHILLGFVNDKDLDAVLNKFPKDAVYYFAKADIPRGLPADQLALQAARFSLSGKSYRSVKKAFAAAKSCMKPGDALYVGGSIFVVAEIL